MGSSLLLRDRPQMILIDLDGTLVDSVPDLAWCVDQMNVDLGLEARGEAAVRNWVGNGVERLIHRALTGELDGMAEDALYERGLERFSALYRDNTSQRSQVYPGVVDALTALRATGYPLACVTNKPAYFTEVLLRDKQLDGFFSLVVAGDTLGQKKPHPAPLLHAARHFGVAPERSLMVGDSKSDVQAARAADFSVVCVSYGYNHGEDIREQHPDAVIDHFGELPGLLPAGNSGP